MPANFAEDQDDSEVWAMRQGERTRARSINVYALLVVVAAQAITPDSQDLSSTALLQHVAALKVRFDGLARGDVRPMLRHTAAPERPRDSRDDARDEGTPDELCLPAVAQCGLPIASLRDINSPSGASERAAPVSASGPGATQLQGQRARASAPGRSIPALGRWMC